MCMRGEAVTEPQQHNYSPHSADSAQFGIHELALNIWQSGAFTPVAANGKKCVEAKLRKCENVWRQSEAAKLSLPWAAERSGQYKHHLQSLQVLNPTYVLGVCQSHWLQVIQFLVITILETISRNEVCVRKRTKKGIATTNRGNWEEKTFKDMIYWIPILFE